MLVQTTVARRFRNTPADCNACNMEELKRFSRKEVAERSTKQQVMFIIHNQVYDVTKFLDDHPGGHEVLLDVIGKDASTDFIDIGHSSDANDIMKKYHIGEVIDEDKMTYQKAKAAWVDSERTGESANDSFLNSWKFPVVLGLLMTLLYKYIFG
ncbi:cytochrome b5-like [Vanessa atalanta]|uniref:cytochrome b5-like n=1 Tax=Vanessa atalanta TaxID=42275 RepID=UPI001FCDD278|nr:cytochrome b5-like [Vanessa atalanta]